MRGIKIIIELEPVTKKNHQKICVNKATGRRFVMPSSQYKSYESACMYYLTGHKDNIDYAVNVCCIYYMKTKRRVDLVNLQEATLDILVKAGALKDDNSNIVCSMDGSRVLYDKQRPRTEIYIERVEG